MPSSTTANKLHFFFCIFTRLSQELACVLTNVPLAQSLGVWEKGDRNYLPTGLICLFFKAKQAQVQNETLAELSKLDYTWWQQKQKRQINSMDLDGIWRGLFRFRPISLLCRPPSLIDLVLASSRPARFILVVFLLAIGPIPQTKHRFTGTPV